MPTVVATVKTRVPRSFTRMGSELVLLRKTTTVLPPVLVGAAAAAAGALNTLAHCRRSGRDCMAIEGGGGRVKGSDLCRALSICVRGGCIEEVILTLVN